MTAPLDATAAAIGKIRERADLGRRVSLLKDFYALPAAVQEALNGIAGDLEDAADALAADREALVADVERLTRAERIAHTNWMAAQEKNAVIDTLVVTVTVTQGAKTLLRLVHPADRNHSYVMPTGGTDLGDGRVWYGYMFEPHVTDPTPPLLRPVGPS